MKRDQVEQGGDLDTLRKAAADCGFELVEPRRPRIEDYFAPDRCLMCAVRLPEDRAHDPYCSAQCAIEAETDRD